MSDRSSTLTTDDDGLREQIAAAFDTSVDPLAEHAAVFDALPVDPFAVFLEQTLPENDPAAGTVRGYNLAIRQWRTYMRRHERHPACPADCHVRGFVVYCREELNHRQATINTKLQRLRYVIDSWQADPVFPHEEYNPFSRVLQFTETVREPTKEPPHLGVETLQSILGEVTHLRDRLVIAMQLKLGLRASELANLRLSELSLDAPRISQAYPDLGSHHALSGRLNAVYIASRYERSKNKSHRPRVLPLDGELQSLLRAYLYARPQAPTDVLVLTKSTHNPADAEYINEVWRRAFHPEYAETEEYSAVTSHFGRHRFTTHWRVHEDVPRELVKYMRGDSPIADSLASADAIDSYVHTYYDDIETLYRDRIFDLQCGVNPV